MYEVGVVGQFEAAHRLEGNFGPATRMHGHGYRVEVTVRGEKLRDDGTLSDIGALRSALENILAELNFRDLGELELFRGRNTTAEVVADVIAERMRSSVAHMAVRSLSVRVWESAQAYAGVELPLG